MDRPIISASHAGQGRMVGYGHEGMVARQSGGNETTLSLNYCVGLRGNQMC